MPNTTLPSDAFGNPIPALSLKDGGAHNIVVSASSARNAVPFSSSTKVISVFATVDVRIKFGGSTVTATAADHFFPANIYYDFAINADPQNPITNIAVLRDGTTDGKVYLSEKV